MAIQTTHRVLVFWLILALLFAQGLRVCMHTYDSSDNLTYPDEITSSHLESTMSSTFGNKSETAAEVDVPLFSLLKSFAAEQFIALTYLSVAWLLMLLTPQRIMRLLRPDNIVVKIRFRHHFTPPLRAPPR